MRLRTITAAVARRRIAKALRGFNAADERRRKVIVRAALETYSGPRTRSGEPQLKGFRAHSTMDVTRQELRAAGMQQSETKMKLHKDVHRNMRLPLLPHQWRLYLWPDRRLFGCRVGLCRR